MIASLAIVPIYLAVCLAHSVSNAGEQQQPLANANYATRHMLEEHHISAFDTQSFFTLHDLNRDGVWDIDEIQAVYGLHHYESTQASVDQKVIHDEKQKTVVSSLLAIYDENRDNKIDLQEFLKIGSIGLPEFPQYSGLGHHYDEESEYYIHHEEIYHSDPSQQKDEDYIHPEDIKHFMHHQALEDDEHDREEEFTGAKTIEKKLDLDQQQHSKVIIQDSHPQGAHIDQDPAPSSGSGGTISTMNSPKSTVDQSAIATASQAGSDPSLSRKKGPVRSQAPRVNAGPGSREFYKWRNRVGGRFGEF